MIDVLELQAFVQVVHWGGFSTASRKMGIPKSTLSRRVAQLEERLALNLLKRTTRKISLTPAGEDFYRRASSIIGDLEKLQADSHMDQQIPKGLVRLTAPVELGTHLLKPMLAEFLKTYPHIQLDVVLSDAVADLIGEGIDVAIRGGKLKDSSLKARRVSVGEFRLYASPDYLASVKTIRSVKDLAKHRLLHYSGRGNSQYWELTKSGQRATVKLENPVIVNNLSLIAGLAESGLGIAWLPGFLGEQGVKGGGLQPVLPGWTSVSSPMYVVYPSARHLPLRTRLFIDFLIEKLSERPTLE